MERAPTSKLMCAAQIERANVMNNCEIITSSKCDLNVVSGQMREKFSNRRHVVVIAELLITA